MKFADAIKKSIEYLASDEFKTREDAESTLPAIKLLQEVNRKGFITNDSQQGVIEKGYNPDSKRYYDIRERAYMTGYMKEVQGNKFIRWINTYTDKIAFATRAEPGEAFKKLFYEGPVDGVPTIPVTISGTTPTKGVTIREFDQPTRIPTVVPESSFHFYRKLAHIDKSEKVIFLNVVDPVYGRHAMSKRGGLFEDVLKGLDASSK
jgi:hypothetical protein